MALTRDFRCTIKARADREPEFREALLTEAVALFLSGDVGTGKIVLRDYINATIGFTRLAAETGTSPKSLMRMLGPAGNPTANSFFAILDTIQRDAGLHLEVVSAAR